MRDERGTIYLKRRACAGAAVSLLMLALTAGLASAQGPMLPMPAERQSEATATRDQMRQMMDARHGEGARERVHQAMGEDPEHMMDQCISMMNMMSGMPGMMGSDGMMNMMGGMRGLPGAPFGA
jgi:hypothetical protein